MAARYALDNKEIIKGLVLWASYPDKDIPFTNITVLSLVGANDGILNSERYETRKPYQKFGSTKQKLRRLIMNMPVEVEKLLKTENFCFLATSYQDYPHVCLMNFTYLADEELIILSSREDTTKVNHIKNNPDVALLLYNLGGSGEMPISCTLNGTATLVSHDSDPHYREYHYKKHLHMGTFIMGENISVITVRIKHAALSDVEDKVRTWTQDFSV